MQSSIINSHEVFIHIHQGCFAGTGEIVRLPQCQWSKPDGYGKISQCITTTKHSKAKTVCIFLGIYCRSSAMPWIYRLLDTLRRKLPPFRRRHVQGHSLEWKLSNLKQNFTELWSIGSNWQYGSFGSDNGLTSNRRQAIIWSSIGMMYWDIYIYVYIYIKRTVFVNVTTKIAQHAHARMIAIIAITCIPVQYHHGAECIWLESGIFRLLYIYIYMHELC